MTEKLEKIIEELKTLTLVETAELVKKIEETFGVDASAGIIPTNIISGISGSPNNTSTPVAAIEEKTTFDIVLTEVPADKKIAILKIVRNLTGLGLKESKDIVDNTPKTLKEGVSKEEAESIKKELETAGAKINLK